MKSLFVLCACLMAPIAAWSMACQSDDDCAANFYCQRAESTVPCRIDADGNEDCPETQVSGDGECVPGVISCMDDEDCPGISTCHEEISRETTDCAPAEGNEGCAPEENVQVSRFCRFEPSPCGDAGACDDGLVCRAFEQPCVQVSIACPEGEDCPEPEPVECDEAPVELCVVQEQACERNEDCAAGWSCESITRTTCSSGGTVPADGAGSMGSSGSSDGMDAPPQPEPAPSPDEPEDAGDEDDEPSQDSDPHNDGMGDGAPPREGGLPGPDEPIDNDCETIVVQLCMPAGHQHYLGSEFGSEVDAVDGSAEGGRSLDNGNAQPTGAEDSGASAGPSGGSSDSGCSAAASHSSPTMPLFAVLGLLIGLRRRRQRP
ncbi:MAG: MYXO-CTERM sorting domain-containing protein [Bradymonadia bacterium]